MTDRIPKGYFQWRCRRGTKELDVMLARFLDSQFDSLSNEDLEELKTFLEVQDTDLWCWLTNIEKPQDSFHQKWVQRIQKS